MQISFLEFGGSHKVSGEEKSIGNETKFRETAWSVEGGMKAKIIESVIITEILSAGSLSTAAGCYQSENETKIIISATLNLLSNLSRQ